MEYKKKILITFNIFVAIFCLLGLIKINIINTKSLSPLGTTADNYQMVSAEFGEDFKSFIQDKSNVKIYEKEDSILVNINDKNFKIKGESDLVNKIMNVFSVILEGAERFFNDFKDMIKVIFL